MSATQRLNAAEKDLERFIKFLALKSTQVVVQSRLGEKIQTQCNPLAGNDWFNIVVQDHPEVMDETKRALALKPGDSILQRLPLCVEISLKTTEGDQMVLEVWSLDLLQPAANGTTTNGGGASNARDDSKADTNGTNGESQTLKASHAIYSRMGIMLKSLISLTRTTPAYKLSRRQCPDSYGIFYRIYVDRPQVHTLGEGHKNVKIGQLHTIVGSLVMSVAYRTKMTISPTTAQAHQTENNIIMLKSDHFRPATDASSPTNQQTQNHATAVTKKLGLGGLNAALGSGERRCIDIEKPLRPGAFTDMGKLRQYTEDDFVLPETPPFEWLLRGRQRHESTGSGCSMESLNRLDNVASVVSNNLHNNNNNNHTANNFNHSHNLNNNSTGFKSFEKQQATNGEAATSFSPIKSLLIPATAYRHHSEPTLEPPPDDDNLLKELHFPFASPTSHVNDLAKFYRECYHAPPLRGLNELQAEVSSSSSSTTPASSSSVAACGPTAAAAAVATSAADASALDDLSRQLEQFETSLEDYDKLVSQFGLTGSSSSGSRSSGGLQMSN
ncbi:autophagy-related protein 13 homolog [Drosophila guanche]|uniref:Autophagy-related protein 13 n=1 Tax=Drosophila guanche TaxID=7266 RepID=A0A3B0K3E6_DROGU|nr:autophagy-related protein 13 homolog [Drosophila guanche]SPP87803.1 blast:Autophagy-related protein 13 homolog [Drosophila guanche]